jgi:succinate dehydrogenase / fumarate reductase membrane anchor subunit
MTSPTTFKSGRAEGGAAFTADRSGSEHTKIMRLSAYALAPLGILSLWFIAGAIGKSYEAVRAEIGRPFPAFTLIAFVIIAFYHARLGVETIIEDYVHDKALAEKALLLNKWLMGGFGAVWVVSILLIAGAR